MVEEEDVYKYKEMEKQVNDAKNNSNEISDAEANLIASRKLRFWLRRIACAG